MPCFVNLDTCILVKIIFKLFTLVSIFRYDIFSSNIYVNKNKSKAKNWKWNMKITLVQQTIHQIYFTGMLLFVCLCLGFFICWFTGGFLGFFNTYTDYIFLVLFVDKDLEIYLDTSL